nr:MAG TPA: hypothetical protein [Caudoviricetes sp.]
MGAPRRNAGRFSKYIYYLYHRKNFDQKLNEEDKDGTDT